MEKEEDKRKGENFLKRVITRARMPFNTEKVVLTGDFRKALSEYPNADLNIFGMSDVINLKIMHEIAELADISCLFVRDSGEESITA